MQYRGIACIAIALTASACALRDRPPAMLPVATDDLPQSVRLLAARHLPGFVISDVQKKVRDGRTYYDVEGELPNGGDVEVDILMTDAGPEIVETQRDIDWDEVPESVRRAAEARAPGHVPARVIESVQASGLVIFELFAPGAPADPGMEVAFDHGVATVLDARWPH